MLAMLATQKRRREQGPDAASKTDSDVSAEKTCVCGGVERVFRWCLCLPGAEKTERVWWFP